MNQFVKHTYKTFLITNQVPYMVAIWFPFHLLAIFGIIYGIFHWKFSYAIYIILGWIIFSGLGTAIMLHRYFSHKSFVIRPWLKFPLYWISCMSAQGSPIWWSALHVGYHHSHADNEKDIHSPVKGFWHSYMGWQFYIKHDTVHLKSSIRWFRDSMLVKFHKYYNSIIWISLIIMFIINPMFALWFYVIPIILDLHLNGLINSICHTKNYGYRSFVTKDMSQNVWWLGLFDWGQGWHNNHHYNAKSYDFGTSISKKWYEFDPCLLWLPFISPFSETKKIFKNWRIACRG